MLEIKEGETFQCEKCGKEWKLAFRYWGHGDDTFVCGNSKKSEIAPDWSGCGHINVLKIIGANA
jgi:hypothetical protein